MKFQSILFFMFLVMVGCANATPTTPIAAAAVQGTAFPTLPLPTATLAPPPTDTSAPPPTVPPTETAPATVVIPTLSPADTATPALPTEQATVTDAPQVLGSFGLNDLPGEGRSPAALALLGPDLYVANRDSSNIGIIQGKQVRRFLPLDANPTALVSDATNNRLYASTYETPTIYLIQNDAVTKQVAAGGRVNALALDNDLLYVALDNDAVIERYDANTLAKKDELKLSQGFGVSALVLDTPRKRLYAGVYGKIVAIDLETFQELTTLDAPYLSTKFAVNPADGSIWSGAYDDQASHAYVVGYSADGKEIARLVIGSDLSAVTVDGEGRLFVLDHFNNQLHVIQTPQAQLVATIAVNESPTDAVIDFEQRLLYVANQDNDNVSAIDLGTLKVVNTIPLANEINALATNPARKRIYAVNGSTNSLYVIENDKVVGEATTGNSPADVAVDDILHRLYVANRADGTLTILDENSLDLIASPFITRSLSTVAVDATNGKVFAGSVVLDPNTFAPQSSFYATGLTLNAQTTPQYERVNPALKKLYALASNGVPGSNARITLFQFLYDDLTQSKMLGSSNNGNTTAFDIDPTTNQLYAASTQPLAYTYALDVYDANDTRVQTLALSSHTTALVVNPETHHLFLAHADTFQPDPNGLPPNDNTVEILDTRTFGLVGSLFVTNDPWRMTLLDGKIYVASYRDGKVTVLGDAATAQPPAPTPTLTPSPFPTSDFTAVPPATTAPEQTTTPEATANSSGAFSTCEFQVEAALTTKAEEVGRSTLGCPKGGAEVTDQFAYQPLVKGFMTDDFRSADEKMVTVFFPDNTWRAYPDTFKDGDVDKQCDVQTSSDTFRPKRGFGSVWCNVPEVQALGPGVVIEHSYKVTIQTFERGRVLDIAGIGAYALLADGTWQ